MAFVPGFGFGGGGFANPMQPQQPGQPQQPVGGQPSPQTPQGQPAQGQQPLVRQGPQSGYGMQNPYHTDNFPVEQPPNAPNQQQMNDFLPPIFSSPYINQINNAQNQSNWFGQSTPAAASFLQSLFGNGMSPMEQTYAGASAQLGARELGNTHNRLLGMFENSASHGSLAPAMLDATNQFNLGLNQMIGQMGTQRQQTAANMVPFAAGFPLQAGQAGMGAAQGLWDMGQNAMYGELNFPMAMLGSNVYPVPTVVAG